MNGGIGGGISDGDVDTAIAAPIDEIFGLITPARSRRP